MSKKDKKIDYSKLRKEKEKADPDLKYDSLNDSHTAIIKRLRHFGKYRGHMYSEEERERIVKMIEEKDCIALFVEYFKTDIEMIFYRERLGMDDEWEVGHVQAEIMLSIPIDFREVLFDRLRRSVDKTISWWLGDYLEQREKPKVEAKAQKGTPEYLKRELKRGEELVQKVNKKLEEMRKELQAQS